MLDEIGDQTQMEQIVPFKTQMERIILVENNIGIKGGLKWTPLKTRVILQSIRKIGMAEIQMERNAPPLLKRLKEMCIYISMSIIEKVFHYE